MSAQSQPSAADSKVSFRERVGIGLGDGAAIASSGSLNVLVYPIYNVVLGVSPSLISIVVFIQRAFDAITDPLVGHFSDRLKTRWGRRKPLIAMSLPFLLLFSVALWWFPRGLSEIGFFWWLLIISLLFHAAHTFYSVPVWALRMEATDDYHERTRVAATVQIVAYIGSLGLQWLFPLMQSSIFPDVVSGLRTTTLMWSIFFTVVGLAPLFWVRERILPFDEKKPEKVTWSQSLRILRSNTAFMILLSMRFIWSFCYLVVATFNIYMNIYMVYGGDVKASAMMQGWIGSAFQVAVIVSVFIYRKLAITIGKRNSLCVAGAALIVGCVLKLFVYQPSMPWLQVVVPFFNGLALGGIMLVGNSMLADVAAYDEYVTGQRRAALFAGLLAWCDKFGNSIGTLLSGFILVWIGFDAKLLNGVQSTGTLNLMQGLYAGIPCIGAVVAILLALRYPLSEAMVNEVKLELNRRKLEATA